MNPEQNPEHSGAAEIRARAEAALRAKTSADPENQAALSPGSAPAILNELQVHQIELEMQNEELRAAQLELEESRARYVDLFDHSPVGYCTIGHTELILQANMTLATLLGLARGALVGQSFARFIVKEDQDTFHLLQQQILSAQATAAKPAAPSHPCELRLKKGGGTSVWVILAVTAARGQNGESELRVVVTDISAQRGRDAADRLEARTQMEILNAIPAHVALVDPEGVIQVTNESWRRFATANLLQGPEFSLGQNYLKVCESATGPCSEEARDAAAGIRRVLRGEVDEFSIEYPCHSPTEQRWFRLMATPLREGLQAGAVVMHLNITERKLAETRLLLADLVLKNVSKGVIITGPDQLIVSANAAFTTITGYSEREILGRNCNLLQGTGTDPVAVASIRKALEDGNDFAGEILNYRKDGTPFWNDLTITPVRDGYGVLTHFIGVTRDITPRRQAAEAQAFTSEMLERTGELANIGGWRMDLPTMKLTWTRETFRIAEIEPPVEPHLAEGINLFAPEARPTIAAAVQAAINAGTPYDLEVPLITAKGRHRWVRTQGFADMHNGQTVRIYGTFQDITARKEAEAALQSRTAFLEAMVDSPLDGVLVTDGQGNKLYQNQRMAELWKIPREFAEDPDDRKQLAFVTSRAKDPQGFIERVVSLNAHPKESSHDEIELVDAMVLERTTSPVLAKDGAIIGRIWTFRDITSRKQAEAAMLASEARSRGIVEASPVPMALNDAEQQILFVNPAFTRTFGYELADIPTLSDWWPKAYPDPVYRQWVAETWQRELARSIQTGTDFAPMELSIRCKDGTDRNVIVSAAALDDAFAGTHLVVLHDITERKRAEARLLASQKDNVDLRAALDQHAIVAVTDARGRITFVNDKFCRISQYPREELLGQDHRMINSGQHPKEFFRNIWATIQSGRVWQGDICNRAKDGTLYWVDTTIVPFLDDHGAIDRYLAIRKDITERWNAEVALRESQERFLQLAEKIQEVFWISDVAKNHVAYISPAYEKIWGRTCDQLYQHPRSWMEAIHPEDRPRIVHAAETKQALGQYDETFRILRPDGEMRWIHDKAFPVTDPTGEVQRIVGTAEDITARMAMEDQMHQSQKLQTIGTLASGIAHDFNNILAAILGNTELAMADTAPEHPARESLDGIKKASARAKGLVQQILAFGSQQPMERHSLALGPVVLEVAKLLRASIPAAVRIETSVDPDAPPVLADATQMHQILVNLCTNAWHALGDQPGCIEVNLRSVTLTAEAASRIAGLRPGRFASLSVRDNGKGMDAATLKRIFDPFFTTKGPGKGTGLGLSVVHGIVRGYQGAIQVVSQPGEGATFTLYFPGLVSAPAATAPGVTAASSIRDTSSHILYVDDDESLLFNATRMLERLGYRVTGFVRPADAVKAFRDNPGQFDLAVTDMNTPEVTGLAVAKDLLKVRADLPIVLVSGNIEEELRHAARAAGIRGIVCKPFTIEEISEAIRLLSLNQLHP